MLETILDQQILRAPAKASTLRTFCGEQSNDSLLLTQGLEGKPQGGSLLDHEGAPLDHHLRNGEGVTIIFSLFTCLQERSSTMKIGST